MTKTEFAIRLKNACAAVTAAEEELSEILLELGDYRATVRDTIRAIRSDFPRISGVFSVNCLFRYKLFTENGYMQEYLRDMSTLGAHAGLVGYGEHYNHQFVNQSMSCVVFE